MWGSMCGRMFRTPLNVGVLNGDGADLPFCTMSALVCAHAPPSGPGWPKRGRVPTRLCGPTVGIHHRGIERAIRVDWACVPPAPGLRVNQWGKPGEGGRLELL